MIEIKEKAISNMQKQPTYNLYPEIEPYDSGWLEVSAIHQIYYEQSGNPAGAPVIFLHGGPGSGCNPAQRRFFDPDHYRTILFDQRGCGHSKPLGSVEENTTDHLVSDIERLRTFLEIDNWLVFGGSWGSTLALVYAISHHHKVCGLILRGIFLSRSIELNWFLNEVRYFYPEAWQKLISFLDHAHSPDVNHTKQSDLLQAYARDIFSDDPAVNVPAAINWNAYESSIMTLRPSTGSGTPLAGEVQVARARVQLHYILNACFVGERNILQEVTALSHVPTIIVQGRYDMVCPPLTAWELKKAMPHAELHMIADAGHSGMEPGTASALVAATEQFKR